jgi:U3 small nucleolar RNA-associated protein 25
MAYGRTTGSYSSLLNALRPVNGASPNRKRRKLDHHPELETGESTSPRSSTTYTDHDKPRNVPNAKTPDVPEATTEGGDVGEPEDAESEDGDEVEDPFDRHFSIPTVKEIQASTAERGRDKRKPISKMAGTSLRRLWFAAPDTQLPSAVRKLADTSLKQRLQHKASELIAVLTESESDVAGAIFGYHDVVMGCRKVTNSSRFRDICVLHALNHAFKTRDRVLKNTAKLSQSDDDQQEYRDQGFTRPKVLIMLPTKQSCVRFIDAIVRYSEPEQQENKARFLETFSRDDTEEWSEKPEDFQELFGGNHEEDFRIGLKFTRKTIKYFSGFYNSDIIMCSPLGLFRAISSGGSKDEKKAPDAGFLSSIEIAIIDHASALQMQNWQHVESAFSELNGIPKESHGCDYRRVREWYLDGLSKYMRQTIILSAYLTPEINALASSQLHNIAGMVKYVPLYEGSMLDVVNSVPVPVSQTFLRFESPTASKDSDARFKYFCASIIPQIAKDKGSKGVLVYVPSYADFTRVRNHLTNSLESTSISFGCVSEYTSVKDTARARSHLLSGRNTILLYTERAHHHFRYKIKGVRKIIFYGPPENPIFWNEIVAMLGINRDLVDGSVNGGKGSARAMFSRWDVLKLERIVGTDRVGRLISDGASDVFDFV